MLTQYQLHRRATKTLASLAAEPHNTLFIHYSCESFYDIADGRSPRVTSIAIRFMGSGQTKSFSIHQQAELQGHLLDVKAHYDKYEKLMLDEFYETVRRLSKLTWVHWNMRDSNYGFEAIAHRYRVLGGTPSEIDDHNKLDLASLMHDLLGDKYVEHPRLLRLLEKNERIPRNFLSGADEATAFKNGEYVKLHQSTLSKVDTLMNLTQIASIGTLKCDNGYFKRRGISFGTVAAIVKEHPIFLGATVLGTIITLILTGLRFWEYVV